MSDTRRDNNTNKPPKVVIINTQYVETDSGSFKDVVQKLTGKNSTVEEAGGDGENASKRRSDKSKSSTSSSNSHLSSAAGAEILRGNSVLTRDFSFKEFERLLTEMPPIDEMWPVDY